MQEITFNKIDGHELSGFVKKLLPIDKFIFMKIAANGTTSSVYLPERDAVKLVNQKTSDIFDATFEKPVKVSFYNGSKVIDALSHFSGDVKGRIRYSTVDDELLASDFIVEDENLTINLACADPSLSFMEMSKDEVSMAFGTDGKIFEFDLLTTQIDRLKSLFNLDKEEEVFSLYVSDGEVKVKGTSYNSSLSPLVGEASANGTTVSAYKKYIGLLDKENYRVIVCENKIVFKSLDTSTALTIALAITDED